MQFSTKYHLFSFSLYLSPMKSTLWCMYNMIIPQKKPKIWKVFYSYGYFKNKVLILEVVNKQSNAYLYRFQLLEDHKIGSIPFVWNFLMSHNWLENEDHNKYCDILIFQNRKKCLRFQNHIIFVCRKSQYNKTFYGNCLVLLKYLEIKMFQNTKIQGCRNQ